MRVGVVVVEHTRLRRRLSSLLFLMMAGGCVWLSGSVWALIGMLCGAIVGWRYSRWFAPATRHSEAKGLAGKLAGPSRDAPFWVLPAAIVFGMFVVSPLLQGLSRELPPTAGATILSIVAVGLSIASCDD